MIILVMKSMSSFNCCVLTCIQISQEASQVVWYSHLFQNFPQFVVIHTVKGFGIINEAEVDVFLEFSCFFYDPMDVGNLILKDDAMNVLHSICQQIWKTQQWAQDWKSSVFIPIPRKAMPKNAQTTAQLHPSHASKVMLKILQARLQQYVNCELPDV